MCLLEQEQAVLLVKIVSGDHENRIDVGLNPLICEFLPLLQKQLVETANRAHHFCLSIPQEKATNR